MSPSGHHLACGDSEGRCTFLREERYTDHHHPTHRCYSHSHLQYYSTCLSLSIHLSLSTYLIVPCQFRHHPPGKGPALIYRPHATQTHAHVSSIQLLHVHCAQRPLNVFQERLWHHTHTPMHKYNTHAHMHMNTHTTHTHTHTVANICLKCVTW